MSVNDSIKVAAIIRDAGGEIVGRTRLQKTVYLLSVAGLEDGFSFAYKHYGPFSEAVATAARDGHLLGRLKETVKKTAWGGTYSVYQVADALDAGVPHQQAPARRELATAASAASPVELELAATAVFLHREGASDPWAETARRKPEKARDGRLERARSLLGDLRRIETPVPLPDFH